MANPQSDFFNDYFDLREKTEPPLIFYRWSLISCLGAFLGRQCWFPFGDGRIFPNLYTMLIGQPATRKSTAIKLSKKIISAAGYEKYSAEKTSKEKFLLDLEGKEAEEEMLAQFNKRAGRRAKLSSDDLSEMLFGKDKSGEIKEPREVFIVADEFNEFVGSGNLEFLSLLGSLWDWDDEERDYQFRLKNSKSVSIFQPTISILAGNTHAGFAEAFPPQAIGQGFLSRIILVYSEPSGKKISFPEPPDEKLRQSLLDRLAAIKQQVTGPLTESKDAHYALDMIYRSWKPLEDGRFQHYTGRRHTNLIKLCMLIAAARVSTEISESDVLYANSLLTYTEQDMPKALGEFGKSRDSDIANKIMQALYETNKALTLKDLMKIVKNDINKIQDLGEILQKLQNSGQIQQEKIHSAEGGLVVGFLPKQKAVDSKQLFVDLSLLREYQVKFGQGLRRVK